MNVFLGHSVDKMEMCMWGLEPPLILSMCTNRRCKRIDAFIVVTFCFYILKIKNAHKSHISKFQEKHPKTIAVNASV